MPPSTAPSPVALPQSRQDGAVKTPRPEGNFFSWHIEYRGNRFAWLGNGFSQTEVLPGGDLSYYLRNSDCSPFVSNSKKVEAMNGKRTDIESEGAVVLGEGGMPLELNV